MGLQRRSQNHLQRRSSEATTLNEKLLLDNIFLFMVLHKKWRFPLKISSVNVAKSAVSCGFGHIYWRNLYWKTSFFVQWWHLWSVEWFNYYNGKLNLMNTAQKIKFSVKIFFLKYEQTAASTFAEKFLNGKLHLGKIKCDIFMAVHSLINIFQIIFQRNH